MNAPASASAPGAATPASVAAAIANVKQMNAAMTGSAPKQMGGRRKNYRKTKNTRKSHRKSKKNTRKNTRRNRH